VFHVLSIISIYEIAIAETTNKLFV